MKTDHNIAALEQLLGGTQCGQCGYEGCHPYAEALARGDVGPERCAPGGAPTARVLARLLGVSYREPSPARGEFAPRRVATVVPEDCVGCMRCIEACPVDAIAGARGRLHYVLPSVCTGCGLCLPACPVDCIRLDPVEHEAHWQWRRSGSAEEDPGRWATHLARATASHLRHAAKKARRAQS